MSFENLAQVRFTEEELNRIDQALIDLEAVFNGKMSKLSSEERQQYGSIAEQNKLFVNKAKESMEQYPQYVPTFLNIVRHFKILLLLFAIVQPIFSQAQIQTIKYEITARNISKEAIDTYPQKLISYTNDDSLCRAVVSTFAANKDSTNLLIVSNDRFAINKVYPQHIKKYLEATALIDYNHYELKNISDSILNLGDTLTVQVIAKALEYCSKRIQFDNSLAQELDKGNSNTLAVATILERGKGTCSEYTNLFLALMRRIGIPCRMAVGWIYMPKQNFQGSHAWAECYIENYGWLGVDPQNNFMWYPPTAIKLFHGKDFVDCNIKVLPDMYPVTVKILE
ncbi:MAG: hypothetical protein CSA05_02595 [Bacteroidia bacterium]|nr:MAG: hypothetical protein CSA05_02595 [Bacteroidia bacterium]